MLIMMAAILSPEGPKPFLLPHELNPVHVNSWLGIRYPRSQKKVVAA